MPKKSTGFSAPGKEKTSPIVKEATPMKTPSLKDTSLPTPIKSTSGVATMPGTRFPKLTRPAPMAARTPKI